MPMKFAANIILISKTSVPSSGSWKMDDLNLNEEVPSLQRDV